MVAYDPQTVEVFFYGLFMDTSLLAARGVTPSATTTGYVDDYRLRIGKRATLAREPGSRTYGVLMTMERDVATALYSDETVADYVPEPVSVNLPSGSVKSAVCYNLPPDKLEGSNRAYVESLLELAKTLGFPQSYLDEIRAEGPAT